MNSGRSKSHEWRWSVGLLLLTLATFLPVAWQGFVAYDDPVYVTANPMVRDGFSWRGVVWAFGQLHGDQTYWHPLTWLSHMLDCQLFGLNPTAHHLVNLAFHAANVLLVFGLLRSLTGRLWSSAVVAGLFAVHPLQVETVAWVTERKSLLSLLFALLALSAYVRYARERRHPAYWTALGFFALALLSKPAVVTLPCLMLLLDVWPLRRWSLFRPPPAVADAPTWTAGRLLLEKVPFFVLAGLSSLVTILGHRALGITHENLGLTFGLRLQNAIVSYARYVGKFVWPADLALLYPHPVHWPITVVLGSLLVLLVLTVWALRDCHRRPQAAVGWLWFAGTLVPMIGLIQPGIHAMADRFMYLPVIGLALVAVDTVDGLAGAGRRSVVLLRAIPALALALCVATTLRQLYYWRNSVSLFEHAVQVTRQNFTMEHNLGLSLQLQGRPAEARPHFQAALRIKPDFAPALYSLGLLEDREGNHGQALELYQAAIRARPGWLLPWQDLGQCLGRLGRTAEARSVYASLLQWAPSNPEARGQAGLLALQAGDAVEAAAQFREALRLKPDWPEVLNNLAWLLATHGDPSVRNGEEAVRLARRACDLTGHRRAVYLGTLAAAWAEAGRFEEAIATAAEARDLARQARETELEARNQELLEIYRGHKPFHEPTVAAPR